MSYFVYVSWSARRRLLAFRGALVAAAVSITSLTLGASSAFADPSANDWARLRMCESSGNYAINTGNGYYGAYQFNIGTWEWMGGTGLPSDASPAEQDYRALKLYRINGWAPWPACTKKLGLVNDADAKSKVVPPDPGFAVASTTATSMTAPSTTATTTKTKKAKSTATTSVATTPATTTSSAAPTTKAATPSSPVRKTKATSTSTTPAPTTKATTTQAPITQQHATTPKKKKRSSAAADSAPAVTTPEADSTRPPQTPEAPVWPGQQYFPGDYSENLKIWQQQAAELGYDVIPTGYFGPKTEKAALDMQRRDGLTLVGYIGPQTWASAWSIDQ